LRAWGYVPHDEGGKLTFPGKKLRAAWFSPPPGLEGSLPRIFVSEIAVEQLSERAATIVRRYTGPAPPAPPPPSGLEVRGAAAGAEANAAAASSLPAPTPAAEHGENARSSSSSPQPPAPSADDATTNSAASSSSSEWLASAAARAWTCVATGALPWQEPPTREDWQLLSKESEYAAWVLAHGYSLNHTALSAHRLRRREEQREREGITAPPPSDDPRGLRSSLADFASELRDLGFALNDDGSSVIKASPGDGGLLLQCSTVADVVEYDFAGGSGSGAAAADRSGVSGGSNNNNSASSSATIPGAYIEFVERRPLPRFAQVPWRDLREWHRRDGFEQASADGIFASTTMAMMGGGAGGGGVGNGGGGGGGNNEAGLLGAAATATEPAPAPRSLPKRQGAALGEGA
jgi:hypothetical protein